MGALTLSDFQTEILAGTGDRTDLSLARITIALNLAQSRIARAYDFSEMARTSFAQMNFTNVPAVDKYLVPPPDVKTIHSFVCLDTTAQPGSLGQSRKVIERPWRTFDRQFPAPEFIPAGWPNIYARWGNIIVMVPAPYLQFTAQLRYTRYPTPFLSSQLNQVSEFENKDDVLITYSLAYLLKSLGRNDRSAYLEELAKQQLDEAIERDDTRPDIEVSRDIDGMTSNSQGAYWAQPFTQRAP